MAVADVYDALISKRVYKQGMTHEAAAAAIAAKRGIDFDPDIVDAFLSIQDTFRGIADRFADDEAAQRGSAHHLAT
jgi:putative two-component system response regulator